MIDAVSFGKKNSAMMSFQSLLSNQEIEDVIYFVRLAFMQKKMKNTKYHTTENGWENHQKYRTAFPFALGKIALNVPDEKLSIEQRKGKKLFLEACISCHDRAKASGNEQIWQGRPLSWPRNNYSNKQVEKVDAISQASAYALHDIENIYIPRSESERKGQVIFQNNCSFCHARDGSAKHWIGQFIEPHPKDFTKESIRKNYSKPVLKAIIRNGKENTAMPAWRYVLSEQEIENVVSFLWVRFE